MKEFKPTNTRGWQIPPTEALEGSSLPDDLPPALTFDTIDPRYQ
jgi:hypothetical protein